MRGLWNSTVRDQRGGVLIPGLVLVTVMTLLGITLLDLSRIEGALTSGDITSAQALYCIEAGMGRTLADSQPATGLGRMDAIKVAVSASPPTGTVTWGPEPVTLQSGTCQVTTVFTDVANANCLGGRCRFLTVTAVGPNNVSRTGRVQLRFLAAPFEYAAVANNGDFYLAGDGGGNPPNDGPGGDDVIRGDIFVSGRVYVGSPSASCTGKGCGSANVPGVGPSVEPRATNDSRPTVSLPTGFAWSENQADNSGRYGPLPESSDPLRFGNQASMPQPDVAEYVSSVGANSGATSGGVYTPGSYQGSPVYNLPAIFTALGTTSNGGLAVPTGCSSSTRPANASGNCKLWWDLKPMGLKKNPPDRANESNLTAGNDYYFDGAFQGEMFSSPRTGERGAQRLVDLNIPGQTPPIFVGDNIRFSWINPNTEVTYGFAINGRATLVATNDVLLSDNIIYREGLTENTTTRADMLGLVAARDIWFGDPRYGTFYEGSGVMLAGRDFNFVFYDNNGSPTTPENAVTLNGTMLANRQIAVFRDFANPTNSSATCSGGSTSCQPIRFDPDDTTCGSAAGCWRFITRDNNGNIAFDTSKASFMECGRTSSSCGARTRKVSHFQMTLNYDNRLFTHSGLVPPGLPSGAGAIYAGWVDWQECPPCT